jgi:hypothetical protein
MKRLVRPLVAAAAALVFVGVGAAWAGSDSHSVKVSLDSPTMVAGKTLAAGHYTFAWAGNGPQVNVTVKRDGKILDETPARLVDQGTRSSYQERVIRQEPSGAHVLESVRLRGESTALVFKTA